MCEGSLGDAHVTSFCFLYDVSGLAVMKQMLASHASQWTCIHTTNMFAFTSQVGITCLLYMQPHWLWMLSIQYTVCGSSRPLRHFCTKDGHCHVQDFRNDYRIRFHEYKSLIWLLLLMQACTQHCCVWLFLFICQIFTALYWNRVLYSRSRSPTMVCSSRRVWSVTFHTKQSTQLILCFTPALCLLPPTLCINHQMSCRQLLLFSHFVLLSLSVFPWQFCSLSCGSMQKPIPFLVVNTFPSMLNNVCLCVQVSLCILS